MAVATQLQARLTRHVARLRNCRRCPLMHPPPVSGGPVVSKILLVGQAPGVREPVVGKPFAWTAGRTLFRWFEGSSGLTENEIREKIYFAAVCRCFPGKAPGGSDRVPNPTEIANCASWLEREIEMLQPQLVIPVGKLAISQFIPVVKLHEIIGRAFRVERAGCTFDLIPLPHPSGASPWHRIAPGKELLQKALQLIVRHAVFPTPVRNVCHPERSEVRAANATQSKDPVIGP
ncbi:MAG: uracil-DNA glycosylase family protein [Chthoniobacterales bacterium]|nr:uracil-DNA glycosylase family protein [Chthoniobacterales bacterium]